MLKSLPQAAAAVAHRFVSGACLIIMQRHEYCLTLVDPPVVELVQQQGLRDKEVQSCSFALDSWHKKAESSMNKCVISILRPPLMRHFHPCHFPTTY